MARKAPRAGIESCKHLAFQMDKISSMLWLDALPQSMIILAEAKMYHRSRNAVRVATARINSHTILGT